MGHNKIVACKSYGYVAKFSLYLNGQYVTITSWLITKGVTLGSSVGMLANYWELTNLGFSLFLQLMFVLFAVGVPFFQLVTNK